MAEIRKNSIVTFNGNHSNSAPSARCPPLMGSNYGVDKAHTVHTHLIHRLLAVWGRVSL